MKSGSGRKQKLLEIGKDTVYIRSNMEQYETEEMGTCWRYDEIQIPKDEYFEKQAEQNALETKVLTLRDKIALYRYNKQRYFEYDGHTQRFDSYDVQRITDFAQALADGIVTEVEWKYPDTTVTITDAQYLKDMKIAGYLHEEKLRGIEKQLNQDETITEDNYQEKFEELI